jgi:hypothetical protein
MYVKTLPLSLLLVCCTVITANPESLPCSRYGVIKDPVIEMHNSFHAPDGQPASPDTAKVHRAHQGLLHEIVQLIKQSYGSLKIAYPNIIYGFDEETNEPRNTFWTSAAHILPLDELPQENRATIPHPQYAYEPTIVLRYPWNGFSVGTRFKNIPEQNTSETYGIVRTNFATNEIVYEQVPCEYALVEIKQDPQSTRKLFVTIINDLVDAVAATGTDNIIPHIWGGSSFIYAYKQAEFYEHNGTWHRMGNTAPYTGYDASEFVMRMAKIAGIDFPWKTTAAMRESLAELSSTDLLQDGDLLWIPGGIGIVSSIERNEITGTRSYASGYGCVVRLALSDCFENIDTYADLLNRYHNQESIRFKNKNGDVLEKEYQFKFLKLMN